MKSELIVMLTYNDITVENALEVFESCKDLPVKYWGFKNVGLNNEQNNQLITAMKKAGKTTVLEVVTFSEEATLEGAKFAVEAGFDYIAAKYYPSVWNYLKDKKIKYLVGSSKSSGSPVMLRGDMDEIVGEVRELSRIGVQGVNIGAYRYADGKPEDLIKALAEQVEGDVVIAGSINSKERMEVVNNANCFGFTMGSALFAKKFVPDGSFRDNLIEVLRLYDEI